MADCAGDINNQRVETFGLKSLAEAKVVRAEIVAIDRGNNRASVTLFDACEYTDGVDLLAVPFDYLCEDHEERTAEALLDGHRAFDIGDVVYILFTPVTGGVGAFIVGHVDIKGTELCTGEFLLIRAGGDTAPAWAGGGYVDQWATIYDTRMQETLDIVAFVNKDGSSPAKPSVLPALYDSAFISWFEYNFAASTPGVSGVTISLLSSEEDGEGTSTTIADEWAFSGTSGTQTLRNQWANDADDGQLVYEWQTHHSMSSPDYTYYDNESTSSFIYTNYASKNMVLRDVATSNTFKYRLLFNGSTVRESKSWPSALPDRINAYGTIDSSSAISMTVDKEGWGRDISGAPFGSIATAYSVEWQKLGAAAATWTPTTAERFASVGVRQPYSVVGKLGLYVLFSATVVIEVRTPSSFIYDHYSALNTETGTSWYDAPYFLSYTSYFTTYEFASHSVGDAVIFSLIRDLDFTGIVTGADLLSRTFFAYVQGLGPCADELFGTMYDTYGLNALGVIRDGLKGFTAFTKR